ncbi:MAG TPA: N-acetylmuramic acid 6-phosphate etherase [Actinobacteria bacterium]|nr:N-acetylmuramic acid 6-phosphate etherase [Actinomycetota bacterium]
MRVESVTEARNPRTVDIDTLPTLDILGLLNDEDALVAPAVRAALPQLAEAVDAAVVRFGNGGTIHYFGAGTSGRIGVLDAAELPPTFSVEPHRVVAHRPGGVGDDVDALEASEDDEELGRRHAEAVTSEDLVIGLTASGRTPYVRGALEAAAAKGAYTVLVSSRPDGPIADLVDVHVFVDTGPEAIAGSTRLKAGTAQKLVLNGFSTALMIRLGKTYSNLMVDVRASNSKLRGRVLRILEEATGADEQTCARVLRESDGELKTALVSLLVGTDPAASRDALKTADGHVRRAIAALSDGDLQDPTAQADRNPTREEKGR